MYISIPTSSFIPSFNIIEEVNSRFKNHIPILDYKIEDIHKIGDDIKEILPLNSADIPCLISFPNATYDYGRNKRKQYSKNEPTINNHIDKQKLNRQISKVSDKSIDIFMHSGKKTISSSSILKYINDLSPKFVILPIATDLSTAGNNKARREILQSINFAENLMQKDDNNTKYIYDLSGLLNFLLKFTKSESSLGDMDHVSKFIKDLNFSRILKYSVQFVSSAHLMINIPKDIKTSIENLLGISLDIDLIFNNMNDIPYIGKSQSLLFTGDLLNFLVLNKYGLLSDDLLSVIRSGNIDSMGKGDKESKILSENDKENSILSQSGSTIMNILDFTMEELKFNNINFIDNYTIAYIYHLIQCDEILGQTLLFLGNLDWINQRLI